MKLVAHRGFAREAPENTLAAVAHAADAGANAVEVDVRAASDGTPVVVHDATVDRVTDAAGAVASFRPRTLDSLSVLDSDEGVPTLAAVLALAADRDLAVIVELKEADVADAAVREIVDGPLPSTATWISSFQPDALRRVAAANATHDAPDVDLAFLAKRRRGDPVGTAVELDCTALHLQYRKTIPRRLVRRAHAADLDVYAWTLASPWLARVVAATGVDGLITDVALDAYAEESRPHRPTP